MIVDHETREIIRTVVFCGPVKGQFPVLMDNLFTALARGNGPEKRTHHSSPGVGGGYYFAQIWLEDVAGYESFLHIYCLNEVPDPKEARWREAEAFVLVHDENLARKFEKIRSLYAQKVFDEWKDPSAMGDGREALMSLLPAVNPGLLVPPVAPVATAAMPAPHVFETRSKTDPSFWLEGALIKAFTSQSPPREQMLFVEERIPHFALKYPSPSGSLYAYAEKNFFEPRSFIEIKKLGYRRLFHLARRYAFSKAYAHFEKLLELTGHAAWIHEMSGAQGSPAPLDILQKLSKEQNSLPPSQALSAVLIHQHFTGNFNPDDISGRFRALLLSGTDEMIKWFPELKMKPKNVKDLSHVYEMLEDKILAPPISEDRVRALYKLALILHLNPGPVTAYFVKSYPDLSLIEMPAKAFRSVYDGNL